MSEEEKQISSDKRYNSILKIIDKHLIPDAEAKKARGEVFTPPTLVREMLFGLRKSSLEKGKTEIWGINENGDFFDDKESDRVGGIPLNIWRDPNTKWLDPANGIGNFPVIAYYMLDYQLDEHGPPEFRGDKRKDKRRKHIIEKMLYMIELDKGNCATCKSIFKKIDPGAKPNICCTNSLSMTDDKLSAKFGVNRFDVIMGNPPFNPGLLWKNFIDFFKDKYSKYLLFIIPSTWTSNETGVKLIQDLNKQIELVKYLKLEDFNNSIELDTLILVLNKNKESKDILINYLYTISNKEPIINFENDLEVSILHKLYKNKEHLHLYKGKNKTLPHKNPKETNNIKFNKDETHKNKLLSRLGGGEIEYYWIKEYEKEDNNNAKILFPRGTGSYNNFNTLINFTKPIVFSKAVSGDEILSDGIVYVPMENIDDYENFKYYILMSKLIRFVFIRVNHLGELTKTIFKYIPKIKSSSMNNDNKIYDAIGLSEREINYIDNFFIKATKKTKRQTRKTNAKPETGGTRTQKSKHKTRKIKKSFFGLF